MSLAPAVSCVPYIVIKNQCDSHRVWFMSIETLLTGAVAVGEDLETRPRVFDGQVACVTS